MTASLNGQASSNGLPTSSSSNHLDHHHHHQHHSSHSSDHTQRQHSPSFESSAHASSSRHTLDQDDTHRQTSKHLTSGSSTAHPSASLSSATRRGPSAGSLPSSPASAAPIDDDDDDDLDLQPQSAHSHLHNPQEGLQHSNHIDHPNTSAMATLTVNTPPAIHQSDPMLQVRSTNSPLLKPTASFHQHNRSPSPPPPPAPYTQPPVTSNLSNVTAGDGWSIVPKCARVNAAGPTAATVTAGESTASTAQQPTTADIAGLSQSAYAHAANDASNRRCGTADLASSYDVPFGERASPAIISLAQRNARPLSRNGNNPPSPLTLSPAVATQALNPSGAHRGGLRGSDEDVEVIEKDVAMDTTDNSCASTGATPLVPPATRKLCVRHQRMADEGTTARLQKVSFSPAFVFHPVPLPFIFHRPAACLPSYQRAIMPAGPMQIRQLRGALCLLAGTRCCLAIVGGSPLWRSSIVDHAITKHSV